MNILITGVSGEVGFELVSQISGGDHKVYGLDLREPQSEILAKLTHFYQGSILDRGLIEVCFAKHEFDVIFHLAAVLSSASEKNPTEAFDINVGGTLNLLEPTTAWSLKNKKRIKFMFPSSVAVYGVGSLQEKKKYKKVKESECLSPITMYGVNKLACENLGNYFSSGYRLLDESNRNNLLDFRCLRFPGLISANTVPAGGTSDFAPEMLHAAAQSKPYNCFVRSDTQIPFLIMPEAVKSLITLMKTPYKKLTQRAYNVSGFSVSAKEIEKKVKKFFPKAQVNYDPNLNRQKIVDSWPMDLDDSKAKKDWAWKADFDFNRAFEEYLLPAITKRYGLQK